MKVTVDLSVCQGYANCVVEAPTVFDLDDTTEKVLAIDPAPAEDRRAEVESAAIACPVRAISFEG